MVTLISQVQLCPASSDFVLATWAQCRDGWHVMSKCALMYTNVGWRIYLLLL